MDKYEIYVLGTYYHNDSLQKLRRANPDYKKPIEQLIAEDKVNVEIWKDLYTYTTVTFEIEGKQGEYPGAIRIYFDGHHIGYVNHDQTAKVKRMLKEKRIIDIVGELYGGDYLMICGDGTVLRHTKSVVVGRVYIKYENKVTDEDGDVSKTSPALAYEKIVVKDEEKDGISEKPKSNKGIKNKWVAFFLCLFLGIIGAHKFYDGKIGQGILYLCTCGLFGIGWLVDIFKILGRPEYYKVN